MIRRTQVSTLPKKKKKNESLKKNTSNYPKSKKKSEMFMHPKNHIYAMKNREQIWESDRENQSH